MPFWKHLILVVLLLVGTFAYAQDPCGAGETQHHGQLTIRIDFDCRVIVRPYNGRAIERSYIFASDGYFTAFIDTTDTHLDSSATGSHTYVLFPVHHRAKPEIHRMKDGSFEILTAAGTYVKLKSNGELESIDGAHVRVRPPNHIHIMAKEEGGISFTRMHGVIVDFGWKTGEAAFTNLSRSTTISDRRGHECVVRNSEMFYPDPRDKKKKEVLARFKTQYTWRRFIRRRCPNVHWEYGAYRTKLDRAPSPEDPIGDLIRQTEERQAR